MVSRTKLALLTAAVLVPSLLIVVSMGLVVAQGGELDVGVFKSDAPDPVPAGEDLTYTILVTNSFGVTATNVVVTDTLPLGVEYITDTDNCLENSGVLTCTLEDLLPGEEVSFTIDVHVALGAYDPGNPEICNSVEVSATTALGAGDAALENNTVEECTALLSGELDVGVFKSDVPETVIAGEDLTYTILVTNSDGATANNVRVTDTLPAEVDYASNSIGCSESSPGVLSCSLADLDPGEEVSFTIDVDVAPGAFDPDDPQICNSVEVSATTELGAGDTNLANNTREECTTLLEEADLTMEKSVFPGDVVPFGEWFSYTLSVENLGPSSSRIPVIMDWFATDGSLSLTASEGGMCGPMPTDQGWAEAPAWLLNWVDAVCDLTGDPYFCDAIEPWWEAWWAYWYNSFPPNYPYPLAVDWMCIWYTDGLEPAAQIDLTVDVLPLDPQTIYNQAWVLPDMYPYEGFEDGNGYGTPDPDMSNNMDEVVTQVGDVADLAIQKWWDEAPEDWFQGTPFGSEDCYRYYTPTNELVGVAAGCPLKFGLAITNTGPSLAENVVVEDFLPAGVVVENVGAEQGSCTTGIPGDPSAPLTCNLGNIPPGEDRWIEIFAVTDGDLWWDRLENDAVVSSDTPDPNNSNNRAHVLVWTDPFSYLYVNKQGPTDIRAGEVIEYSIDVSNLGPSTAHDVYLGDQLPEGVSPLDTQVMIGDGSCIPNSTLCSLGDLAFGEWNSVRVRGYVEPWVGDGKVITNTVNVWALTSPFTFTIPVTPTWETVVHSETDLSIQKSSEPMKVYPGEQKVYHIEVTNHGPADAPDVIVTDTLPISVTYEIDNDNCEQVGWDPDVLECHLGTIPGGQTVGFDISALVFADAPPGEITNTVVVSMPYDSNYDNNIASATNLVLEPIMADLELQKTASTLSPYAGTDMQFTLLVTNHGPVAAENVVLEDMLPEGVSVSAVNPSLGSCTTGTPGSEPLRCDLGTLAVNASATVIVSVHIDPDYMGTLENDAVVSSDIHDQNNGNNRDFVIVNVNTYSLLFLKKGCGFEEEVLAGEPIQYDILVRNNGPSTVHNFELWDLLPDDVTYLSYEILPGGGQCFYTPHLPPMHGGDGPGLHCYLGDVAPTDTRIVYITVRIDPDAPAGELTNEVTDWDAESNFSLQGLPSNRECSNIVVNRADLSIRKTADPYKVYAGEQVRYDIAVTNNGPSMAHNVVVTDTLPISVTYEIDTAGCSLPPSGILNCNLGDIPPGETSTFSIWARVKPDTLGMINNRVDVMSDTEDPNPNNDWDTEANLVLGKADLRVLKYGKPHGIVEAGEELTYTVIVDNLGPGYAHDVVLYDLFSSSSWAYYVDDDWRSDRPADCLFDRRGRDTRITCQLDDALEVMSPSSSGRWVLKFYLEVFEEQSVNNVAQVVASDADPDQSNNYAIVEHEITSVADLDLEKEAWGDVLVGCEGEMGLWPDEVAAGGVLTYTLNIYNEGPSEAENVVVEDWGLSPFLDIVDVQCEKDDSWRECSCNLSGLGELGDTNRHLVCYLGEIDRHDEDVITISARIPSDVPEGTRLVNDARVYSDVFDDDNGDNLAGNWTYVIATADLGVEKSQEPDVTLPGLDVTYTITVTNHGLSDAHGVLISDTLPFTPTSMTVEGCASDGGQCDVPCDVPTCPAGECPWPDVDFVAQADIPAGEWVIYTLTATPEWVPCETITNTVEVVAPPSLMYEGDIDPCPGNDVATTTSDPECNFVPLALKSYPGPDSPP